MIWWNILIIRCFCARSFQYNGFNLGNARCFKYAGWGYWEFCKIKQFENLNTQICKQIKYVNIQQLKHTNKQKSAHAASQRTARFDTPSRQPSNGWVLSVLSSIVHYYPIWSILFSIIKYYPVWLVLSSIANSFPMGEQTCIMDII